MRSPWDVLTRLRALVVTLVALALLAGCSAAKMIYSQMPRIAVAKLDDAFDLRQDQKRMVRGQLDLMLLWHRSDQIPRLVEWLGRVEENLKSGNGFSSEEILDLTDTLWTFRDALYDYVYAKSYPFLASLDAGQVAAFAAYLAQSNKERFAELEKAPEDYAKIKKKLWQKRFEDWIGDLTEQQVSLLVSVAQVAHEQDLTLRETSLGRQRDFVALLQNLPSSETDDFAATLWKLTPASKGTERFERGLKVVVGVGTTLSDDQKKHLAEQIKVWQRRLGDLALVGKAP